MTPLPIGSKVFCHGFGEWGAYTFTGIIEGYSYAEDTENYTTDRITGYKVKNNGAVDSIWLRDAELV